MRSPDVLVRVVVLREGAAPFRQGGSFGHDLRNWARRAAPWTSKALLELLLALPNMRPVERFLVLPLNFGEGVLEDFALEFFALLGLAQAVVHHHLVVLDQGHLPPVLGVEVVLTLGELIFLLALRGRVTLRLVAESVGTRVVLAQAAVECLLAVSRFVHRPEAARIVRNVSIAAASIVDIDNGLRVDVGQRISWLFLGRNESAYRIKRAL